MEARQYTANMPSLQQQKKTLNSMYAIIANLGFLAVFQVLTRHVLNWKTAPIVWDIFIKISNLLSHQGYTIFLSTIVAVFYIWQVGTQLVGMTWCYNVLMSSWITTIMGRAWCDPYSANKGNLLDLVIALCNNDWIAKKAVLLTWANNFHSCYYLTRPEAGWGVT